MAMDDRLIGTVVDGRYRIEAVAGEGGFGLVYRAQHLTFDAPVALKFLKLSDETHLRARASYIAGFRREGQMLFKLSELHPAFVQVREAGTFLTSAGAALPYLVLEWLPGVSMKEELLFRHTQGLRPFTLSEVIGLLDSPAEALARAHRSGICHRDLKPGNVFFTQRDGTVGTRVLDFGLAKAIEAAAATGSPVTTNAARPFTPAYAAPEQWSESFGPTGAWTDVHAWALLCVELLTGIRALDGSDRRELRSSCLASIRPTPNARGADLSRDVEAVFSRALALDPSSRYPDMADFWADLRRWAGLTVEAVPVAKLRSWDRKQGDAEIAPSSGIVNTFPTAISGSPRGSSRMAASRSGRAGVGSVVLLIVVFGFFAWRRLSRPLESSRSVDRLEATPAPPIVLVSPSPAILENRTSAERTAPGASDSPSKTQPNASQPHPRPRRSRSRAPSEKPGALDSLVPLGTAVSSPQPDAAIVHPQSTTTPTDLITLDELSTRY